MLFQRESGVLLHPTSLPGPYGIGEIGSQALAWIDTLAEMGQRLWQVLPLGPTGFGDSPYQNLSTFAAGTLLIGFDGLLEQGLLARADVDSLSFPSALVDFGPVIAAREALLQRAAAVFARLARGEERAAYHAFCARQAAWLDDWALFAALKQRHEGRAWPLWPRALRDREPALLERARAELRQACEEAKILQFLFARQWDAVRRRARQRGLRLVGDIPIFVAHDSADVWQRPDLFRLDDEAQPTVVAGVPPDYFSRTGQRWGNPLYRWETHAAEKYAWWTARVRRALELVDVVRIDHFRGFAAYWEIPAAEPTAVHGRWVPGPGAELFHVLRRELGDLPIIAEDLGLITPDVAELRDELDLPGMRVLQFAFDGSADNPHLPENYVENCVAYTGTHDNDTLVGWLAAAGDGTRPAREAARERARLRRYLRRKDRRLPSDIPWACIDVLLRSRASAAILPLQDILGLGSEARMNTPGRPRGNWAWRFQWEELTEDIRRRLEQLTRAAQRAATCTFPDAHS